MIKNLHEYYFSMSILHWFRRQKETSLRFPKLEPFCSQIWDMPTVESHSVHQSCVPQDARLFQKLGILPKQKILFFAGCYGDWAGQLAQQCEVHYTDISKSMTRFVKTQRPEHIRSFRTRPAELQPRRPFRYDWSFSFEPHPLTGSKGSPFRLALLRSLLNTRGAKIVFKPYSLQSSNFQEMKEVAKIYGAKARSRLVIIRSKEVHAGVKLEVMTLETNSKARKKAALDVKVLHHLNWAYKRGKSVSNEELARLTGASIHEIEKSRERLSAV
jgi:hypothetical protein